VTKRFLLLFAVLVAGWVALWLLRTPRAAEDRALPPPSAPPSESAGVPATLEPAASDDDRRAPQREPIEGAASAREAPATSAARVPKPAGSSATLEVRVVGKGSGAPLSGARIRIDAAAGPRGMGQLVEGFEGTLTRAPRTGADGRAAFVLPSGVELRLSVSGDREDVGGAELEIRPLTSGEARELVVELPTGIDLPYFGRLLAREDGAPVAGATIELIARHWRGRPDPANGGWQTKVDATTTSDAQGVFELSLSSWKSRSLRIRAPGFAELSVYARPGHESRAEARVIRLVRPASLHARVLDASGAPLAGVGVHLWCEPVRLDESDEGEPWSASPPEWNTDTDSSGACTLLGLTPEVPLRVELLQGGAVVRRDLPTFSLRPNERREAEWSVGTSYRIEGSVVDPAGAAVAGLTLWIDRTRADYPVFFQDFQESSVVGATQTDARGRFAFADVAPGRWWIGPAAGPRGRDRDPAGIAPLAQVVEVLEGELRTEVLLTIQRGLTIRGRVLDPAGEPAPGIHVVAWTDGSYQASDAGADGAFTVGPLVPGRYRLRAYSEREADSPRVEASAGDEGVELCLQPGGTLSGTVVDGATGRASAATITLVQTSPPQRGFDGGRADDDGAFRFQGLGAGTYDLAVRASGQRVGQLRGISVAAGSETTGLVVTLVPGAALRVKCAVDYLYYEVRCDGVLVAGAGVDAGATSESAVPAGHLVVECSWAGDAVTKDLDVAIGELVELVFGDEDG